MRRRFGLAFVPLILMGAVSCGRAPLPELIPAKTQEFAPNVQRQIELAVGAVRREPRSAPLNGKLGMTLQAYAQYEAAEAAYHRAQILDPKSFSWAYYLGIVQAQRGEIGEAAASFRHALKLRPDCVQAQVKLGEALRGAGDARESVVCYRRVLEQNPSLAMAYYGLGRALDAQNQRIEAAQAYARACELYPAYGAAHYALATDYRLAGDSGRAAEQLALYQRDEKSAPPEDDPLLEAVGDLDQSPNRLVERGLRMVGRGNLEEAARLHEQAIEADPRNASAHLNLINIYLKLRQYGKAEQMFREAEALTPQDARLYNAYGALLLTEGRAADAAGPLRRALTIDPNLVEAHQNMGYVEERLGRMDEAIAQFRTAVRLQPAYHPARLSLGKLLLKRKRYTEAEGEFLRLVIPAKDELLAIRLIAKSYQEQGCLDMGHVFARKAAERASAAGQQDIVAEIKRSFDGVGAPR